MPNHPLWQTLHLATIILVTGFVLWLNASEFDETELKSIAQIAATGAGLIGGQAWLAKRLDKGKADETTNER